MLNNRAKPYLVKIKRYVSFGLLLSCFILLTIPACGGGGGDDIGSHSTNIEVVGLEIKWSYPTGDSIYSSPALAQDSTLYIGSDDGYLYALNRTGTLIWRFQTGGAVFSSPTVGDDGTIYVGSNDNYLYAINPDGTQKWSYLTGDNVFSTPALNHSGIVYIGSNDGQLYAITPEGNTEWITFLGGWVCPPAIGPDNTIYVGAGDINWTSLTQSAGQFYALEPQNGAIKWQAALNIFSRAAIGSDGTVYTASTNGNIYALNPDTGEEIWRYSTDGPIISCPKVLRDGTDTIIIGSDDKKLYALTSNGILLWVARLRANLKGLLGSSRSTGEAGNH